MAYDQDHVLITVHGALGAVGLEEWSFGLRCRVEGEFTQAMLETAVHELNAPTVSFFADTSASGSLLTHIKMARIATTGLYPDGWNAVEHTYTPPVAAGGAAMAITFQTALAVTWMTDATRGKAHEGRSYLAYPKFQPLTDGRISAANALSAANAGKAWLNGLLAVAALDLRPAVFSKGTPTSPAPLSRTITGVRVGRVLDTMRSRRRNLQEEYQAVDL